MSTPGQGGGKRADGLAGEWLSLDEVAALEFFKGAKRAFKLKLNANLEPKAGEREPGIKAVVRRQYAKGDLICEAGAYGSTAFLLLEGTATAFLPQEAAAPGVPGRGSRSLAGLMRMFRRRTQAAREIEPGAIDVGEVSRYGSFTGDRRLQPTTLGPGDVFGVDTCINFYPREATVRAEERCVVLEMLRSVLDSVRDAGTAGADIDARYRESAIRSTLHLSALFRDLDPKQLEELAAHAELLIPESDDVHDGVIYAEGDAPGALYLVRAGTIKLAQRRAAGEVVLAYLGRGAAFGLEALLPSPPGGLVLRCTTHPELPVVALKGTMTLGRSPGCEVVIPDPAQAVGRKHCRIEEREGEFHVVDLESANFTLLNGERIHEAVLAAGDTITLATYTFEVTRGSGSTAPTAPAPTRFATASGLDNFEIVRIPSADVLRAAAATDRVLKVAAAANRSLEARGSGRPPAEQALTNEVVTLDLYNSQNVLLIDLERCTRCDECVRGCADAHDGVARFTRDGPRFGKYLVTMACRSCTDPKCMVGCPVGSIRRTESLEIKIEDWCIGCERCANQCPFGNINMVELAALKEPPRERAGVSLRATVCDLCSGYDGPNCVYSCPHDAAIRVNPGAFLSLGDLR